MGVVKGTIALKDNATAVLQSIRKEQSAFQRDVEKTKSVLKATWDKKYQARIEATAASKALKQLQTNIAPLRKNVVTAVAIKDMATAKVKALGNQVKAVGKMVATPFVKLKDGVTAGLSKIKSALANVAKNVIIPVTLAASVATTAVVGGAIHQGAALEQSIGGVETLFKDDASVVKANADAAFKTAGLSANAYMEQVTSFSASLISSLSGNTAKAATVADMAMVDMADNANKFGTEMESIQNAYQGFAKQNYTMLDNLKLGYGGTKEEMQRLLADAQKLTGTKYDIDNLADVYSAIHAIQENLGVTGTTAKEASATFSGSFSAMKAAAQNLLGNMAIGGDVTGSMEQLIDSASTFLIDNAAPMVGRVIASLPGAIRSAIKSTSSKIKASGGGIIESLKAGMISILPSSMGSLVNSLFDNIGNLGNGFTALLPQLQAFGTSVMGTIQKVAIAVMPTINSIISTVQTVIPAVLPVLQTVITNVGNIIAAAAPIISGLVTGIGTAVSVLAPVFQTIFDGIGEKVGSVLSFVGSQMGWIQEIIETAAPVIASILTTAWSVASPILDMAISVFKLLFNVTKTVFNGIVSVVSSVWEKIQPIVQGVANGLNWIKDKVTGLFGGGGGDSGGSVGTNAEGTNNWRGGVTWVGEKGPELIDLPRGTRILPNKESVSVASQRPGQAVFQGYQQNTTQQVINTGSGAVVVLERIDNRLANIEGTVIAFPVIRRQQEQSLPSPMQNGQTTSVRTRHSENGWSITLTIAKLADTIIVREDGDIDAIGEAVAKKVIQALQNMPQPA